MAQCCIGSVSRLLKRNINRKARIALFKITKEMYSSEMYITLLVLFLHNGK